MSFVECILVPAETISASWSTLGSLSNLQGLRISKTRGLDDEDIAFLCSKLSKLLALDLSHTDSEAHKAVTHRLMVSAAHCEMQQQPLQITLPASLTLFNIFR